MYSQKDKDIDIVGVGDIVRTEIFIVLDLYLGVASSYLKMVTPISFCSAK